MSGARGRDTLVLRLRVLSATSIVLVLISGAAGVWAVHASTARVTELSRVLTPAIEANAEALQLMSEAQAGLRGYRATGEELFLEPFGRARQEVLHTLVVAEELGREAGVQADFGEEQVAAAAWLEEAHRVVDTEMDSVHELLLAQSMARFRVAQRQVDTALTERREVVREETRAVRRVGVPALAAMTITFVLAVAVRSRSMVRAVEGPMDDMRSVLDRLRQGESHARADVTGPAEVREVAAAVNALAAESERLRQERDAAALLRARTREAARAVREPLDQEAVLRTAARVLGQLVGAEHAVITHTPWATRVEDGAPGRHARWSASGDAFLPLPDLGRAALRALCAAVPDGEALVVPTADGTVPQALAPQLAVAGVARAVVARVGAADDSVAVVTLTVGEGMAVTDAELHAVQLVCADLSRALEHAEIYGRQLELVDRLQELDRQKADFLSTVSHELRTPLTSIAGYTEMLREGVTGAVEPRAKDMLDVVHRNVERLTRLIEDLLVLSHIEAGTLRTEVSDVDLAAVVDAVVLALAPTADAKDVTVTVDSHAAQVRGDLGQLERVLLNLVSNAIKFTPDGGSVHVQAGPGQTPDEVRLVVQDTGIGIPAQDMDKLTERFFRASNAVSGAVPGTGLGLSIVRRVVEGHGGRLDLTSVQDEGTRIQVVLPTSGTGTVVGEQQGT